MKIKRNLFFLDDLEGIQGFNVKGLILLKLNFDYLIIWLISIEFCFCLGKKELI